ncbi:hypothetical protein C8A05DRAFT_18621 [Staphylotrichum tortipilum]|uniref:Uncharacterized protein n=1 Tax=Staphylotrichum tortipilum TaxID=2831512 RepID=A0AAN6MDM5_9PEZI|nr:hypothetical protein C8A05DRAFT_18621 [Staphylotrichum longicolle]
MRQSVVASLIAAGGVLAAAVPGTGRQQKPLGYFKQLSSISRQYLSCEETYGGGWETCGDQNSELCYSPALGHSCCEVDNSHCGKDTWCAPVAGYCCLHSEDLDTCARNAGFELLGNKTRGDL